MLENTRANLDQTLLYSAIALTLAFIWLLLSQVVFFLLGWALFKNQSEWL
jgi:hypothetical protein